MASEAKAKRGLGRGLGALIPSADHAAAESIADASAVYAELPVSVIVPNPRQPRVSFDEEALAELVFSIKEIGLLQPIVVRRAGVDRFELIAGERRLRASREAGMHTIPAIIRSADDDAMLRDALLENLHRADLNPLEEAAAYQQLLSDFGCTQDELARRVGRSRPQVSNTLRLLRLPAGVQRRVAAGVLSAGHARALLALDDADAVEQLANRIVAEGLSVRNVEELILLGEADGRQRTPRTRSRRTRDPQVAGELAELTDVLADRLDTKVSADGFASSRSRGRLIVECADIADLRRVLEAMLAT